jgi:hypothetical protein
MTAIAVPGMPVSVSLPAGGATAAKQDTGNATLAAIQGFVDGIEGSVDGLEGLATVTNALLNNIATRVPGNLLGGVNYDYIEQVQAALTDTWTFKEGGAGGILRRTITITYATADKAVITTVVAV